MLHVLSVHGRRDKEPVSDNRSLDAHVTYSITKPMLPFDAGLS
jgi:hypothetical protein